jgi:hypothetical protein
MATDNMQHVGVTLKLGADGEVPLGSSSVDVCTSANGCPPNKAAMMCAMLDDLPTGPMWDEQKARVREEITAAGGVPTGGLSCLSMAAYAAYMGAWVAEVVGRGYTPYLRESAPDTAVSTLDDWLERFGWVDCYRSPCRSDYAAESSPYEYLDTTCNKRFYHPPSFPADYERALKYAILQSLVRLNFGVIKNVAGINWVIEPLGAKITPKYSAPVQEWITANETCHACWSEEADFTICNVGTTLPGAPTEASFCGAAPATVAAQQTYTKKDNSTVQLYPGVVAAQCIASSLMPVGCPSMITRC